MLSEKYNISMPTRAQLDLLDAASVRQYLKCGKFDAVIHLATPTAQNPIDRYDELFERSLKVFMSLLHCSNLYGKMLYLGSGAEYGKHRAITCITENEFGCELPQDSYGLSRYIMSQLADRYNNVINLRVFGCYGCGDPPYKLIPHVIGCIKKDIPIELRQNTRFDFLYANDITQVLNHFIENTARHKAYNLCSGEHILIGNIADEVRKQMKSDVPIVFRQEGYGLDYTGNNTGLRAEIPDWTPRPISEGVREIIDHENRKT
jgi:GDP-L-fucose synthase